MVSITSHRNAGFSLGDDFMLHDIVRSLEITHAVPNKGNTHANGSMSLLDLQGMQPSAHHKTGFLSTSDLSVLICL